MLTTVFVAEAQSFVRETLTPLLAQPPDVRQTLYWYLPEGSEAPMLCLDGSPHIMPPPPTWREHLDGVCALLGRAATFENVDPWRRHYTVEPDQLDLPMDATLWRRNFDFVTGPRATAASLLGRIHLGPDLDRGPRYGRPHINFGGKRIRDNHFTRWVTASDILALSLLQARLIDLDLPIKVEKWDSNRQS